MLRSEIEHVQCTLAQTALMSLSISTDLCMYNISRAILLSLLCFSYLVQGRGCLVPTGHVSTLQRCR